MRSDGILSRFILAVPPHVNHQPLQDEETSVEVIARLSEEDVGRLLDGWQDHMRDADGVEWIRGAVA